MIHWEGQPTAFAFQYPYILAFDSSFIEIRHIDTVSNFISRNETKKLTMRVLY